MMETWILVKCLKQVASNAQEPLPQLNERHIIKNSACVLLFEACRMGAIPLFEVQLEQIKCLMKPSDGASRACQA